MPHFSSPRTAGSARAVSFSFLPALLALAPLGILAGCDGVSRPPPPATGGVYALANGCYRMDIARPGNEPRFVKPNGNGVTYSVMGRIAEGASAFRLRATDLGAYLLYDTERRYFTAELDDAGQTHFPRPSSLLSDVLLTDDTYISPAEWEVSESEREPGRYVLRHRATGRYLGQRALEEDARRAASVTFYPAEGCADFPELTLDADGEVSRTEWDDGDVYGIVDSHSHLLTNFGFGGGGIFHGAPFHRYGVQHALSDCSTYHGAGGRRDLMGYFFDGDVGLDPDALLDIVIDGMTPTDNHRTDGYPTFSDWPNSWRFSTHQMQYYRWLERAYHGGLRLVVQHATGNSVMCDFFRGIRAQEVRYSCNDMVSVDRQIQEARNMERYIDAQHGGPGRGWFRIVESPEEARAAIREGKMAVVLGIEISNLFDCFITQQPGDPTCDEAYVSAQLDRYHELGIRVLFPNHKYDNAFTPGDGHRGIVELGNFINSGHWSNYTTACPADNGADSGAVQLGGINMPRDEYLSEAPHDMRIFQRAPLLALAPFMDQLAAGSLEGDHCQNGTLTPLGEYLLSQLMDRGMLIELDHLSRWSYERAFEILEDADYPALGTHGRTNGGRIYDIGGLSKTNFGRCSDPNAPGRIVAPFVSRAAEIESRGGYPAEGLGFDLNGFAGGPRPRFGPDSNCGTQQLNPVRYPFDSYGGDVTFTEPQLGEREVNFNFEGMIHIGLLPEMIEDARRDGATDEDLEPLFRSAEAYIRVWERAEARGAARR